MLINDWTTARYGESYRHLFGAHGRMIAGSSLCIVLFLQELGVALLSGEQSPIMNPLLVLLMLLGFNLRF